MKKIFTPLSRNRNTPNPNMLALNTRVFITLGEIENIPGKFKGVSYNGYFVEINSHPGVNIPMEYIKLSVN